jgi:hypothetical protein
VLGAAPVKISGSNIQDNTLGPLKIQRTGSPPTDNQVPAYDNATGLFKWGPGGSGTPGGSSGQLQFNDNGAFGAVPGPGYNPADNSVTFPSAPDGTRGMEVPSNTVTYTRCTAGVWGLFVASDNLWHICTNGVDNVLPLGIAAGNGFIDEFSSSIDNTTYLIEAINGASASQSGGELTLTDNSATHEVMVAYRTQIGKTDNTYKLDIKWTSIDLTGHYWMRVEEQASLPTLATHDDAKYLIMSGPNGSGAVNIYYKPPSDVDTLADSGGNGTLTINTYYRLILETTTVQWRYRYMSIDEQTTILDSGWITWANTRNNSTNLWLILAEEPYAGNYGTAVITRFEVQ